MKRVLLVRGGRLSPFSGLGSTHEALEQRLAAGIVEGYSHGKTAQYSSCAGSMKRLWRRWFSHPKTVQKLAGGFDIIHITDQEQAGLVPDFGNTVVTVHDLFHLFPTVRHSVEIGNQKPRWIRRKDLERVKAGINRAKLLVCISKDTQQECEMRFPGVKTMWIPHAINLEDYSTPRPRPDWFKDGKNLLVIGSEEPRKRVEFAVEVCGGMDVCLHKVGAESSPQKKAKLMRFAVEQNCDLNWVGRLEPEELIAALQHADALLFPSVAEGFGLPPLEAYAAGTVALVADAPAANEIPLERHILPHDDLEQWRDAISQLKDESEDVQERAAEFCVKNWAEKLKKAYDGF